MSSFTRHCSRTAAARPQVRLLQSSIHAVAAAIEQVQVARTDTCACLYTIAPSFAALAKPNVCRQGVFHRSAQRSRWLPRCDGMKPNTVINSMLLSCWRNGLASRSSAAGARLQPEGDVPFCHLAFGQGSHQPSSAASLASKQPRVHCGWFAALQSTCERRPALQYLHAQPACND